MQAQSPCDATICGARTPPVLFTRVLIVVRKIQQNGEGSSLKTAQANHVAIPTLQCRDAAARWRRCGGVLKGSEEGGSWPEGAVCHLIQGRAPVRHRTQVVWVHLASWARFQQVFGILGSQGNDGAGFIVESTGEGGLGVG